MLSISEADLIRLAKNGQVAAFEELIRLHQSAAYNLACRLLGNPDDAADIAQEALVRAFRALPKFREDARFGTWLHRIVTNACLDELRSRKRRPVVSLDQPADDERPLAREVADPKPGPEDRAQAREERELIQTALAELPEIFRYPLVLRDVQGYSYEEIAEMLDVPAGTVKSRIHRARLMMRARLAGGKLSDGSDVEPTSGIAKGGVAQ